jgi:asparagine synthase (glutamine-hydrolysing)
MCGIAGIIRFDGVSSEEEIQRMTRSIAHRGPDGEGIHIRKGIALGHRRLSIIDLENGKQPMLSGDGELAVTFNGEIYNYPSLKEELKTMGFQFRTNSDTEILIAGYNFWGNDFVKKLRGMFAFCLVDFRKRKILLARDQFGIKPLIYRFTKNYFAFSSEISALRLVNDEAPKGNVESIEHFLRFSYIPAPATIFKGINKLLPGHCITLDFEGKVNKPEKFYQPKFGKEKGSKDLDWVNETENTLKESVKSHLLADVPFGVFLSGGIDSTLVAGMMSKLLGKNVNAFAIGFDDKDYNELEYAKRAADFYGIHLTTHLVSDQEIEIFPDLLKHYGEPFGDSSAIPTWHVSKLARAHVPMVLSGDGGDELFAGYLSHKNWLENSPGAYIKGQFKQSRIISGARGLAGYTKRFLKEGTLNLLEEWYPKFCYSTATTRKAFWNEAFQGLVQKENFLFEKIHTEARNMQRLDYAQYMDMNTNLPGHILTKVDIASMYHGLEVRTPILDREVLDLAARIPTKEKFNSSESSPGKYNLKRLLGKDFGRDFIYRKKQGFSIPKHKWFAKNQSGYQLLLSLTGDKSNQLHHFFQVRRIESLLMEHSEGKRNHADLLWLFLTLGLWFRDNPSIVYE